MKTLTSDRFIDWLDGCGCIGYLSIARFNADGTPDAAFGDAGRVERYSGLFGEAHFVAVLADQRIFVGGTLEDGSGSVAVFQPDGQLSVAATTQYVWSPRYIDAPVLRDTFDAEGELQAEDRLYYLGDANYNITALVDPSGQVVERYVYSPYGMVTVCDAAFAPVAGNESAFANTVLYTGRVLDLESGLHYYRARYYDAMMGRFTGRDPLGYGAGDGNLYRYCGDMPTQATDPSGLLTVHFVPNMVALVAAHINPRAGNVADVVDIAFDADAQWRVDNAAFTALGPGKQEIGIIQIIKLYVGTWNPKAKFQVSTLGSWEIDSANGTGFYGTPLNNGAGGPVRGNPTAMPFISFEDNPNMETNWGFHPCKVKYEFETYVVGISGPAGMVYTRNWVVADLSEITVFAGIAWGATFDYTANNHYNLETYLNQNIALSNDFEDVVSDRFAYSLY